MSCIVSYIAIGIITGVIFGISYAKLDKKWEANTVTILIIPITWGILTAANNYFELTSDDKKVPSACYLVTLVITFLIVFVGICYLIKTQRSEEKVRIRVLDIILGFTDSLQEYYNDRCAEIRKGLSLDEYKIETQNYLETKKKADYSLKKLSEKETAINDLLSGASIPVFEYPIECNYPVTEGFIKALPLYVVNYATFQHHLINMTREYMSGYEENLAEAKRIEEERARKRRKKNKKSTPDITHTPWDSRNDDVYMVWDGYFFGLCHLMNTVLFDTKKNMVRSHVRILLNEKYEKLVAFTGEAKYEPSLTPIPKSEGMIIAAHNNHTSLVKSLNVTNCASIHFKGNNDSKWEDYLTFTIADFEEDGYPLISMGISIANSEKYRDLLYFVNYLRIEDIVTREISRLNKAYDLRKFIQEWREKNGG